MSKYFFGSYFKLQSKDKTLALIPSYSKVNKEYLASLQIITHNNSYILSFPFSEYEKGKGFNVRIKNNVFNENGIKLDIDTDEIKLNGKIRFDSINKLNKNIMGQFKLIPFLQCIHSVHSIKHKINGKLYLNDEEYDFTDSLCYIEGDRGRSFPSVYLWSQALFDNGSIMLSVADIPFGLFHFTGVIGFVNYNGKTIRFGTYNNAKPIKITKNEIIIKKGKYRLILEVLSNNSYALKAPLKGEMTRIIKESAECQIQYTLLYKNDIIFKELVNNSSFEYEYDNIHEIDKTKR